MNILQIYQALEYGNQVNGKVNPLFSEAKDAKKWEEIRTSPYWKDMLDAVNATGDAHLQTSIEALPYSSFTKFSETGSRKEYDMVFNEHRSRLHIFALLSLVYPNDQYIKELEDIIWAVCDEYTWCKPEHMNAKDIITDQNDHFTCDGRVVAGSRPHRQSIDLLNASTAFALAEILDLHEHRLSPQVVFRARKEITERVLEPLFQMNSFFGWETSEHNWAAVCGGCVGSAALYLMEDNRILAPLLHRLISSIECFLGSYEEDGFSAEGMLYWEYGFGHFVYFAELLKQKTAGKIDLLLSDKVREIALFPQRVYLGGNKVFSFSDSTESLNNIPILIHRLKSIFPEVQLPGIAPSGSVGYNKYTNWAMLIRSIVWSNSQYKAEGTQATFHYYKNAQYLIRKKQINGNIFSFAAIGGKNGIHHNHNDVGHFILHKNGETLLTDLGRGEYNAEYFGPNRYSLLCLGSQGHCVPIIEGSYQKSGPECYASILGVMQSEEKDYFGMELAKVYSHANLKSLVREFNFEHKENIRLILKDSFIFEKSPISITERFISKYKPVVSGSGTVLVQGEKSSITIEYDEQKLECNVKCENFLNFSSQIEKVYCIDFEFKSNALSETTCTEIIFCL